MALGIEGVVVNVNGQDKRYYVLTEDGLEVTDMGYFEDYEDVKDVAEIHGLGLPQLTGENLIPIK